MRTVRMLVAVAVVMAGAVAGAVAATPTYLAGKTYGNITLSSTTLNFSIKRARFTATGDYAVIQSSFSRNASDQAYVRSAADGFVEMNFAPAINPTNTGKAFKATLQSATTLYYYFEGVVE